MSKQTKTFKILTSPSGDYKCQGSRQDDDKSQQNSDHEIKQDRLPFPLKTRSRNKSILRYSVTSTLPLISIFYSIEMKKLKVKVF